jgi:MOSC domain-containing protein YiiM
MVKRFLNSRRTGFYFAVAQEGEVESGDAIELLAREPNSLTVADVFKLYALDTPSIRLTTNDREKLQRAVDLEALPDTWRGYFQEQLQRIAH